MSFPQYAQYRSPFTGPAPVPPAATGRCGAEERVGSHAMGALAYVSALPLSVFGPALFWLCASPGSFVRREAAKALRLTAVLGVLTFVAAGLLDGFWMLERLPVLGFAAWVLLMVFGAVQAGRGVDWETPVDALLDRVPVRSRH